MCMEMMSTSPQRCLSSRASAPFTVRVTLLPKKVKISVPRAFHVKKNCSPATYNYTASPCARTCWNSLRSVSMRQVPADFQTTFTRKRRGAKISGLMPLMHYKKLILLSPSPQDPPPVHIPTQKFLRKFSESSKYHLSDAPGPMPIGHRMRENEHGAVSVFILVPPKGTLKFSDQ